MAGLTSILSSVLDEKEIQNIASTVKDKLQIALGSKDTEITNLKSELTRFRADSGQAYDLIEFHKFSFFLILIFFLNFSFKALQ